MNITRTLTLTSMQWGQIDTSLQDAINANENTAFCAEVGGATEAAAYWKSRAAELRATIVAIHASRVVAMTDSTEAA